MRRWAAAITAAVFIVSSIPYLYGLGRQTATARFSGIVFDVVDTAQYFAWMRAFSHSPLIANPLTPEPGAERFFNLQWWLLGLLAYDTPLGPNLVYQGLRVVALAGFALALWGFCRRVAPNQALLSFSLVMLSSGFGWALVVAKQWTGELRHPLDVQVGEANTFFSAMAFPHLLVAAALMLAIYNAFLDGGTVPRTRTLALAGLLTLALGFSHGYDLIPTVLIPAATAALLTLRERRLSGFCWPAIVIGAAGVAPGLYALSLTRLDRDWEGVLSQYGNAGVYTPAPHHLIVLLGLPLLLALPQLRPACWRSASTEQLFVRVWAVLGFGLLYIPTDYQIKMLTGYQVPLCILAAQTVAGWRLPDAIGQWRLPARRLLLPVALIAVVLLTNLYLTAWRVVDLRRADYPYYLTSDDVRALEALEDVAGRGEVVISSPNLGQFVPVYSDARPFVAHWAQTLHYFQRRDQARWFFAASTSDVERDAFLRENGIDYVIAGPAEAADSAELAPPLLPLDAIGGQSTILYRVRAISGSSR
jgi:hypothetical protein